MDRLKGRTALVAGGGSGIGLAIAKRFHEEGAFVVICGRREEALRAACSAISGAGERVAAVQADLTREEDIAKVVRAQPLSRGLDVLANCMGIMRFARIDALDRASMQGAFETNTFAPWRLSVAALPLLKKNKGSIVNISSISGMRPFEGSAAYCMSKAALIMMSQVMALELAADGVRVNVICPGMVEDTGLGDAIFSPDQVAASYERFRSTHPLGRNGKPSDVAEAALFFASAESSWVTGAVLPLDGGRHLTTNKPG
jgi:meso-butanediol dehydrogenase / (S,S)-butanediol dehydrogenase / diacetyl reductase